MRSAAIALVALLVAAAGCVREPDGVDDPTSLPDAGGPVANLTTLALRSTLQLTGCASAEYLLLLDEPPPASLPEGMQPILADGRVQVRGVSAECLLDGTRAAFTLGAVLVNVTGPMQGPGQHGVIVRVAIDSVAMRQEMASWGLSVPEQRAWTIRLEDGEQRRFLHLDDPSDIVQGAHVGNVLHLTRFDQVEVAPEGAGRQEEPMAFRWFEVSSYSADGVVTMVVDEERAAYTGVEGPARVQGVQETALDEGLHGAGLVADGLDWTLHGRQLPAA